MLRDIAMERCTVEVQSPISSSHPVPVLHRHSAVNTSPMSAPVLGGSKLPPLTLEGAGQAHPTRVALQQASGEVGEAMRHLLGEAQSAESRIQRGIETLWQTMLGMLEQHSQEMQQQLTACKKELEETQSKLARSISQEAALVQQNARTSMQLTSEEKRRKELETALEQLRGKLGCADEDRRQLEETNKKRKAEQESLQTQLEEKTTTLREYQAKISKLTEKMNRISKDLSSERIASEKLQKDNSGQLSQHVAENRKLALEISKLKAQVSSSSSSLEATRKEMKKLELQLKTQQQQHEAELSRKSKTHTATVQELEQKVKALEEQLEQLKRQHQMELDAMKTVLMEAHKGRERQTEDHLEARIRFLQHQNKQEKIKLQKEISTRQTQ